MEPPIQTEYFRSGGAMILTFMDDGARAVISFCIRSEIPGYMVVPPDWEESVLVLRDNGEARTYHNNVAIKILTNIDITFHDGVEGSDVNASRFETENGWLEESFWGPESLVTDSDDLSVGKFVGLLESRALGCGLDFLLEVKCHVAELLLDIANDFTLSGG
jgi:hypothetical protein